MTLINVSKEILQHINNCLERFDNTVTKPEKTEALFYNNVKPTYELIMNIVNDWKSETSLWIATQKPKYIHQAQIDSTVENIEQVVLQSFYKDVNKQRFYNLHHSVEYVINSLIKEVERD